MVGVEGNAPTRELSHLIYSQTRLFNGIHSDIKWSGNPHQKPDSYFVLCQVYTYESPTSLKKINLCVQYVQISLFCWKRQDSNLRPFLVNHLTWYGVLANEPCVVLPPTELRFHIYMRNHTSLLRLSRQFLPFSFSNLH